MNAEKPTPSGDEDRYKLEIARITSRQAISVALISAVSGLLGAGITALATRGGAGAKSAGKVEANVAAALAPQATPAAATPVEQKQLYLHIKRVELTPADTDTSPANRSRVRVVILALPHTFSYPGNEVWEVIGPDMRTASFPLNGIGHVQFQVLLTRDGRKVERLTSNRLAPVNEAGSSGAEDVQGELSDVKATVRYEVRSEP